MTWVEFEPTTPASERAKTVHILDSSATVIGVYVHTFYKIISNDRNFECSLLLQIIQIQLSMVLDMM
jgi:hypothetical protein